MRRLAADGEGFVALDRADDDLPPLSPEVVARLELSDEPVIVSEEDAASRPQRRLALRVDLAARSARERAARRAPTLRRPDARLYNNADW
jgi:hypothetical protein